MYFIYFNNFALTFHNDFAIFTKLLLYYLLLLYISFTQILCWAKPSFRQNYASRS